jgi:hypothetical protein
VSHYSEIIASSGEKNAAVNRMVVSSEPLSEIKRGQIEMLVVTGGAPFLAGKAPTRMVKKLEWIEMAQLAVSSILFKSLSLKLP